MTRTNLLLVALPVLTVLALAIHSGPARAGVPWGNGDSQGEDLAVSLVTFGPGDDITEWFGHTALVVEDQKRHVRRLYNYGEFSFDDKMAVRYAMGHLEFWVGERMVDRTLDIYAAANRSIRSHELNLTPTQRLALARALADNALPDNKTYVYDHYTDNCATRPRDMLDQAIGGALEAQKKPARMTLRDHTRRHTAVSPFMSVAIDFVLADEVDAPITTWEEAFLPGELEATVLGAVVDGKPLGSSSQVIFEAKREPVPTTPPVLGPWFLAAGLVLGGVIVLVRRRRVAMGLVTSASGLALGIPGTVLFLMATMTDHHITRWNENLLLANPLSLALAPLGLVVIATMRPIAWKITRGVVTALGVLAVLAVLAKVVPAFNQDNVRFLGLIVPMLLGLVVAWLAPLGPSGAQGLGFQNRS